MGGVTTLSGKMGRNVLHANAGVPGGPNLGGFGASVTDSDSGRAGGGIGTTGGIICLIHSDIPANKEEATPGSTMSTTRKRIVISRRTTAYRNTALRRRGSVRI